MPSSKDRFRAVFDQAAVGVALVESRTGRFLEINDHFCAFLGYSAAEVCDRTFQQITHPDDLQLDLDKMALLLAGKVRDFAIEKRYIRKDGSIVWVLLTVSPLWQPGQEPYEHVAIAQDITEKKVVVAALNSQQRLFKEIAANYPNSFISIIEKDLTVGFSSGQEFAKQNLNPEDFIGLTLKQVFGEHAPTVKGFYLKTFEGEEAEFELYINNQHQLYRTVPLLDQEGEIDRILVVVENITERKEAEEEQRANEERFHQLFNTIGTCVAVYEPINDGEDFAFVDINPAGEKESHVKKEEIVGRNLTEVFPGVREMELFDVFQRVHRTGKTEHLPIRQYKDDRITEWVENTVYRLPNGQIVAVYEDTSREHLALEALKESEKKYRLLTENSTDIIWTGSLDGRLDFVSPFVREISGYTPEEMVQLTPDQYMTPESESRVLELLAGELAKPIDERKNRVSVEVRQIRKDGSVYDAEITAAWRFDEEGNPVGIQGTTRDISERKLAEQALAQSEAFTRLVLDNLPVGIAVNSVDPEVEFEYMNDKFSAIYRTTRQALANPDAFWEAVYKDPDFREIIQNRVTEDVLSGDVDRMHWEEVPLTRKGRETTYISARNIPLPEQNMSISTVWDVTERVRAEKERSALEDQLRQSQKMESIGRLAGGVAHDFNNMLTAISGFSDLVYDSLKDDDPLKEDVAAIQKAASSAAALTAQLLAFSRKQIISPKVLDLNKELEHSGKMLRRIIGEDIDLVFSPGEDLFEVKFDPSQIEQILINLAANARDAMPDGGSLTIATKNQTHRDEICSFCGKPLNGDYAEIAVSDTGGGMDESILEKIFEPFFTTKARGKGTGLGLSTVHGIVLQNNGHIHVETQKGVGTKFCILLPKSTVKAPQDHEVPKSGNLFGTETILLVEDMEIVRKLAVRSLKAYGYSVIESEGGSDAIAKFEEKKGKVDLLVTDVVMPQMSGKELFDLLEKRKPDLTVLFMSGYTDDAIAHHGVLEEGVDFIQKPFRPQELAEKVREVLDRDE
jgi:PAS domain S-box-containing protein